MGWLSAWGGEKEIKSGEVAELSNVASEPVVPTSVKREDEDWPQGVNGYHRVELTNHTSANWLKVENRPVQLLNV